MQRFNLKVWRMLLRTLWTKVLLAVVTIMSCIALLCLGEAQAVTMNTTVWVNGQPSKGGPGDVNENVAAAVTSNKLYVATNAGYSYSAEVGTQDLEIVAKANVSTSNRVVTGLLDYSATFTVTRKPEYADNPYVYGSMTHIGYSETVCQTCLGGTLSVTEKKKNGGVVAIATNSGPVSPGSDMRFYAGVGNVFTGSNFTLSSGTTKEEATVSFRFQEEDPWAILRNTEPLVTTGIGGPSVIEASFSPKNSHGDPIRLECLANALGFDHFNWKQTWKVTSNSPVEILKVAVDLGDASQPFKAVGVDSNPMIDPATDFPLRRIITKTNDGRSMLVLLHGGGLNYTLPNGTQLKDLSGAPPDSKPLYYNESGVDNMQWKDRGYINNGYSAYFYDAPQFDAGWANIGDYFFFETELQGVDKYGNGTPLGVGFTWRTEAKFGTGSVVPVSYHSGYLQVLDRSGLPPVTEGGVELIEIFNKVPEPSILHLLSILAAGISRRHIRVAVEGW